MDASYHVQHGCHDCAHVFRKADYDYDDEYYCRLDAPDRPLCGSVFMGESWVLTIPPEHLGKDHDGHRKNWDDWCEGREVKPWGTCKRWKEKQS